MVRPTYPEPAKKARIQGKVLLHCLIGLDGSVEGMEVVTGHELLAQAAKEAVLQWKYEPPKLNGKPVQTDLDVEIIFELPKEEKKAAPK
jgi:protein TonB